MKNQDKHFELQLRQAQAIIGLAHWNGMGINSDTLKYYEQRGRQLHGQAVTQSVSPVITRVMNIKKTLKKVIKRAVIKPVRAYFQQREKASSIQALMHLDAEQLADIGISTEMLSDLQRNKISTASLNTLRVDTLKVEVNKFSESCKHHGLIQKEPFNEHTLNDPVYLKKCG